MNARALRRAHLLVLAVGLSACPDSTGPGPCTVCPQVAGTYNMVTVEAPATSSTCGNLALMSTTTTATVQQPDGGAPISIQPWDFTGTVNSDWSVTLTDIVGNLPGTTTPGTFYLTGKFQQPDAGVMQFSGYFAASRTSDKCSNTGQTLWTRQ